LVPAAIQATAWPAFLSHAGLTDLLLHNNEDEDEDEEGREEGVMFNVASKGVIVAPEGRSVLMMYSPEIYGFAACATPLPTSTCT